MLSINTNISSIVAQRNMTASTNKLSQAIERLTTGYKINHAGDNAANYSISTDMNVQLSSYDIAADNIAMGMDLLSTAQDTIAGMQERGSRIHALVTQARNGTYGADSLSAMTQEANALVSEINRLYMNTEYNGKKLLEIPLPEWAQTVRDNAVANAGIDPDTGEPAGLSGACGLTSSISPTHNGFIDEVVCDTPEVIITNPVELANAISTKTIIGIGNAETLAELANLVNGTSTISPGVTKNCSGKTIVLTSDVDLTAICAANTDGDGNGGWNPIGNSSKQFKGIFNGNGHKVTGLYIKRAGTDYQGLFGYTTDELKNIGVEGGSVTGNQYTAGLSGLTKGAISNCYMSGNISGGTMRIGGLIGMSYGVIMNCYTTGKVTSSGKDIGGLVGYAGQKISICYSNCNVSGKNQTGGLIGSAGDDATVDNSYATGIVIGTGQNTGGLVGYITRTITNCYVTGTVTGTNQTGGLAGYVGGGITDSYATGNVTGKNYTGGLAGAAQGAITNCYATGSISGEERTGGLAGYAYGTIRNSYATGNVTGNIYTGGLVGRANGTITNSYATGSVEGNYQTGGLAGDAYGEINNSYATGNVSGNEWVGGLVGRYCKTSGTVTNENILSSGNVSGNSKAGSLIGGIVNTSNGSSFSTINITNATARSCGDMIGFEGKENGTAYESGQMATWLENITAMRLDTTLQVGIHSNSDSQITVDTSISLNLNISDLTSDSAYNSITSFLNQLSAKSTEIGAAQNRLESALESTMVSMDNLTSSLSTIRDANIAQVSSDYIRQQILQQAAATLMSTANQSPSIALQLI